MLIVKEGVCKDEIRVRRAHPGSGFDSLGRPSGCSTILCLVVHGVEFPRWTPCNVEQLLPPRKNRGFPMTLAYAPAVYCTLRRLRSLAIPARPIPSNAMLAGSGTLVGAKALAVPTVPVSWRPTLVVLQ